MSVDFHFLNVGHGDCTIIHFPARIRKDKTEKNERIMMVDMYYYDDHEKYENVIDYYKKHFRNADGSIKPIFRYVCTHPHQDHICGLKKLLDDPKIKIINFWDLKHSFEPENFDGHPTHEDDWKAYKTLRGDKGKSPAKVIRTDREDSPRPYWNEDEDRISVLSPSDSLVKYAHYKEDGSKRNVHDVEIDEMSYGLIIRVNERKIILSSDGRTEPFWSDIFENCKTEIKNCSVLKAGHHGQESGFHEDAVKLMNPEYILMSNSAEDDKEHGAESLYKKAVPKSKILKTCDSESIIIKIPFSSEDDIEVTTSK